MSARWVVQLNLGKDEDARRIKAECDRLGQPCDLMKIIPFSGTLPHVASDMPTIFYGGTNWINAVWRSNIWSPGAWFDDEKFLFSSFLRAYGQGALNSGARTTSFIEFILEEADRGTDPETMYFIRPERDAKEFAGDVIRLGDFKEWFDTLDRGDFSITRNTRIIVGPPYGISHEWRCFMVDGRVSSASLYRKDRIMCISDDVPQDVIEFAEAMANLWSPSDAFVMDVARSAGKLYVLENNCINSAGMYACDIEKIVRDLSDLATRTYKGA